MKSVHIVGTAWLSATGRQGAPPPLKDVAPLKFSKTTDKTIGTIVHCFKNNGLLSFAPLNFFLAESQLQRRTCAIFEDALS